MYASVQQFRKLTTGLLIKNKELIYCIIVQTFLKKMHFLHHFNTVEKEFLIKIYRIFFDTCEKRKSCSTASIFLCT